MFGAKFGWNWPRVYGEEFKHLKSLQTDGRTDRQKTNDQKLSGTLSIINKALQILTICGDQGDAVKFDVNFAAISVTYHLKKTILIHQFLSMKANFMLQDYVMNKYTYNEKNPPHHIQQQIYWLTRLMLNVTFLELGFTRCFWLWAGRQFYHNIDTLLQWWGIRIFAKARSLCKADKQKHRRPIPYWIPRRILLYMII